MSVELEIVKYKLNCFFTPSTRGSFGPAPMILLILLFVPSGLAFGFGAGFLVSELSPDGVVNFFGFVISAGMSMGLILSLTSGVMAHPSELDFVMTSPVRPRSYLLADLMFVIAAMGTVVGFAGLAAVIGLMVSLDRSLAYALPLLAIAGLVVMFVYVVMQTVFVLRVKYPRVPMRIITVVLIFLSIIPTLSFLDPSFPIQFSNLPLPQSAFAYLMHWVVSDAQPDLFIVGAGFAFAALIVLGWFLLSTSYFYHGVKPMLQGGFGQVDMDSKIAQQRRMISGLGKLGTAIPLRTWVGSELSLMTRLHMIRYWRDGSLIFVMLFVAISVVMNLTSPDGSTTDLQFAPIIVAILAMTWLQSERVNLWMVATAGRSVAGYFRGMLLGMVIATIAIWLLMVAIIGAFAGGFPSFATMAYFAGSVTFGSMIAAIMCTRLRLPPTAFSPMLIVVFFVIFVVSIVGGFFGQVVISGAESYGYGLSVQSILLALFVLAVLAVGYATVSRLAYGFRV